MSSACRILPELADRLGTPLPAPRQLSWIAAETEEDYPDLALECELSELEEVRVRRVQPEERRDFRRMMRTHHPKKQVRCPGGSLSCWIESSRHGRLGGLIWSAASWRQAARDQWIGWSARVRMDHLDLLVRQSRFLILPGVQVPNLASHALSRSRLALVREWTESYGAAPLLEYTYVDGFHAGACYQAAGWSCCKERTAGCPPNGEKTEPKAVWMHPLADGWKSSLCAETTTALPLWSGPRHLAEDADWADREYGARSLADVRLRRRLLAMGRAWEQKPGAPIPQVFPAPGEQRAACRLLSNSRVTEEHVLDAHQQSTVERCRQEPLVLAVQDTTMLNWAGLEATQGLSNIGGGGQGVRGMPVHVVLAITPAGRPLGILSVNARFRAADLETAEASEGSRWLEGLRRTAELAEACPNTRVVAVCDREADMFEMLQLAAELDLELLVRSSKGTKRTVQDASGQQPKDLWEKVASQAVCDTLDMEIPASGGKRARSRRTARLELRTVQAAAVPPQKFSGQKALAISVVSATETGTAPGAEPLHWVLLSTGRLEGSQHSILDSLKLVRLNVRPCTWVFTSFRLKRSAGFEMRFSRKAAPGTRLPAISAGWRAGPALGASTVWPRRGRPCRLLRTSSVLSCRRRGNRLAEAAAASGRRTIPIFRCAAAMPNWAR